MWLDRQRILLWSANFSRRGCVNPTSLIPLASFTQPFRDKYALPNAKGTIELRQSQDGEK